MVTWVELDSLNVWREASLGFDLVEDVNCLFGELKHLLWLVVSYGALGLNSCLHLRFLRNLLAGNFLYKFSLVWASLLNHLLPDLGVLLDFSADHVKWGQIFFRAVILVLLDSRGILVDLLNYVIML